MVIIIISIIIIHILLESIKIFILIYNYFAKNCLLNIKEKLFIKCFYHYYTVETCFSIKNNFLMKIH